MSSPLTSISHLLLWIWNSFWWQDEAHALSENSKAWCGCVMSQWRIRFLGTTQARKPFINNNSNTFFFKKEMTWQHFGRDAVTCHASSRHMVALGLIWVSVCEWQEKGGGGRGAEWWTTFCLFFFFFFLNGTHNLLPPNNRQTEETYH